jgi:hypothetical protein
LLYAAEKKLPKASSYFEGTFPKAYVLWWGSFSYFLRKKLYEIFSEKR